LEEKYKLEQKKYLLISKDCSTSVSDQVFVVKGDGPLDIMYELYPLDKYLPGNTNKEIKPCFSWGRDAEIDGNLDLAYSILYDLYGNKTKALQHFSHFAESYLSSMKTHKNYVVTDEHAFIIEKESAPKSVISLEDALSEHVD